MLTARVNSVNVKNFRGQKLLTKIIVTFGIVKKLRFP